jgi:hypothetical protein
MNTRPTPETNKISQWSDNHGWTVDIDFARKLERERDEARDENGTWKQIASGRLSKIAEVTAQRDKLAEALNELRNNESMSLGGAAYEIVEQALQSLTPKEL